MRRALLLLCLVAIARAGDEPVVRIFDAADLKTEDTWWAIAKLRVQFAAQGAQVRYEKSNIIVVAPEAVQQRIANELTTVRDAFGKLVQLEVRVVRVEGGLGVPSVPAEKLEALLKEKKAESLAKPNLVCRNGQQASISVLRQISYVSDFSISLDDNGGLSADPVVDTLEDGITAKLRPFVAGQAVRVSLDVSVTDVAGQMPEIELPFPLPTPVKVQVPESTSHSVRRIVDCPPSAYAVIDLGGGTVVLILATCLQEKGLLDGRWPGQDVPLK